jgi:hypothetical protein
MAQARSETSVQARLLEMEERLRALQAELEQDVGVEAAGRAERDPVPPRSEQDMGAPERPRAARLFPPPPSAEPPPTARYAAFDSPAPPPASDYAPDPAADPPRVATPSGLEGMSSHLVRAMRELLGGYELALAHAAATPASLSVSAGPFSQVSVVEQFRQAVLSLPGVASVEVRGYEGSDRAIVEVQLRGGR